MARQESCIFGLGCTSLNTASHQYYEWLKRKGKKPTRVFYVGSPASFRAGDGKPRLLLVDGVSNLFQIKDILSDQDRIVISDSPILLGEIPHVPVLDMHTTVERPWAYSIAPFNPRDLHERLERSYKRPIPIRSLGWERKDQLGLIVENNVTGCVASPYKNFLAQLSHDDRVVFRKAIASWIEAKTSIKDLEKTCKDLLYIGPLASNLNRDLSAVLRANETLIQKAVPLLKANKSIKTLLKDQKVTMFEMKFLAKLVGSD